jgi:hypothetical protein
VFSDPNICASFKPRSPVLQPHKQVVKLWFCINFHGLNPLTFVYILFSMALAAQSRAMASSFFEVFRDHTQRHTTVGRTPLDEWSARRRDLYLTTHNTHNAQISMPSAGFKPTISAGERPLACWDCAFEPRRRHGCLSVVSVVCRQVEVSAPCWSLVQRSPTDCGVSECDWVWSWSLGDEETLAHLGLLCHEKRIVLLFGVVVGFARCYWKLRIRVTLPTACWGVVSGNFKMSVLSLENDKMT